MQYFMLHIGYRWFVFVILHQKLPNKCISDLILESSQICHILDDLKILIGEIQI